MMLICTDCRAVALTMLRQLGDRDGDVHWKPGIGPWRGIQVHCGVLRPPDSPEHRVATKRGRVTLRKERRNG